MRNIRVTQVATINALRTAAKKLFGVTKYWNQIRAFGFENFQCIYRNGKYRCKADVMLPDLKGKKGLTSIQVGFVSYGYQKAMMKLMKKAGILCSITFTNVKASIKRGDDTYVCPVPFNKLSYIDNWVQPTCTNQDDYKKAAKLVKKSFFKGRFPMPIDSKKKPVAYISFNSCVNYWDVSGIVPTGF